MYISAQKTIQSIESILVPAPPLELTTIIPIVYPHSSNTHQIVPQHKQSLHFAVNHAKIIFSIIIRVIITLSTVLSGLLLFLLLSNPF